MMLNKRLLLAALCGLFVYAVAESRQKAPPLSFEVVRGAIGVKRWP